MSTQSRGEFTFGSIVVRADPDWVKDKRQEAAYEFSNGAVKTVDPENTGAYADE